jgi:ribosomal protein S18 acetylase RimI-like enzyme
VSVPDHVRRAWHALDASFATVEPTAWGAVVTDGRFPRIWDANYARVDADDPALRAGDVEEALLPALARVGADIEHVLTFHHEAHASLLAELSSRGHRLGWDLVMDLEPDEVTAGSDADPIEELRDGPELWDRVAATFALFGVDGSEAVTQLRALERDVLARGGKRWFGVRDEGGRLVSLAAMLLLEGSAYLDNVATFPEARGRGYATALTTRIAGEAQAAGAGHLWLLCDADDADVVRMYRRVGFREAGLIASTRGPLPGR